MSIRRLATALRCVQLQQVVTPLWWSCCLPPEREHPALSVPVQGQPQVRMQLHMGAPLQVRVLALLRALGTDTSIMTALHFWQQRIMDTPL